MKRGEESERMREIKLAFGKPFFDGFEMVIPNWPQCKEDQPRVQAHGKWWRPTPQGWVSEAAWEVIAKAQADKGWD